MNLERDLVLNKDNRFQTLHDGKDVDVQIAIGHVIIWNIADASRPDICKTAWRVSMSTNSWSRSCATPSPRET